MFAVLIGILIAQRISELVYAESNRRWSLARGGSESGAFQYYVIVAVHSLFFVSLALEWHYLSSGWNSVWPIWLSLLFAAECIRLWAICSLGRRWNTRVIVVPESRPVTGGPYRFIRHPNYLALILEFLSIPILCGAYLTAAVFSGANALILAYRIPQEEHALANAGGSPLPNLPRFLPRIRSRRGAGRNT